MNTNQLQHGDVLLSKLDRLPDGVVRQKRGNVLLVMAGEATGHNHVIKDKTSVIGELKGQLYLEVTEPTTIVHEEHKPIDIPTGIYQIGQVREYDHLQDMERKVID
jgi:hypothetical protein